MKMVKSLLLGSAAGMVAVAGAQAADLPVKAKAVEYVKICSLYGDGFYYIPGTDFCIKWAGKAQGDYGWNVNGARTPHYTGAGGAQDRSVSPYTTRHRGDIDTDVRTQSAYGTVRMFTRLRIDIDEGASSPALPRAFIQWAGFTFGRVKSVSDVVGQLGDDGLKSLHQTQNHNDTGANGNNEISYTWELGNGMAFHVGAGERRVKSISNLSNVVWTIGANPITSIHGQQHPNPFAAFNVNQGWGRFAISATANPIHATYYGSTPGAPGYVPSASCNLQPGTTWCGYASDTWGGSVNAGLEIKTPWIAPGDFFGVYGAYGVGALAYATGNNLTSPGLFEGGNNAVLGALTDAVYVNGSGFELTTAFTVGGGFMHWWSPTFSTTVFSSLSQISYNDTVVNNRWFCAGGGAIAQNVVVAAATRCDPGFTYFTVGTHTDWYPVAGMRLGVEVMYTGVDMNEFDNTNITLSKTTGLRATGVYTARNNGILSGVFRAQRNWPAGD